MRTVTLLLIGLFPLSLASTVKSKLKIITHATRKCDNCNALQLEADWPTDAAPVILRVNDDVHTRVEVAQPIRS